MSNECPISVARRQWTGIAVSDSYPSVYWPTCNGARRLWTCSSLFHGGESGSIPLGSANPFKYLAVRPRFASNICPIYSCEIGHVRRSPRSALSFVGAAAEQSHHRSQSLPDFQDGTPNCRRCGRPREDHQVWCALLPAVRPGLLIGARPPHLRRDVPAKFCGLVPPIRAGGI